MRPSTVQELLADRRANVEELRRENNPTARALLEFYIAQIDTELAARNRMASLGGGAEYVW